VSEGLLELVGLLNAADKAEVIYVNARLSKLNIWNTHCKITIASHGPHFVRNLSPSLCFLCI